MMPAVPRPVAARVSFDARDIEMWRDNSGMQICRMQAKSQLPMVVEASLTTRSAKNAAADYRAIQGGDCWQYHFPTALGGHAWLIELQAPHSCYRKIIVSLSPLFHRI